MVKGARRALRILCVLQQDLWDAPESLWKECVEDDFETLLKQLQPAPDSFRLVSDMLSDLWQDRLGKAKAVGETGEAELMGIETTIEGIVGRITETESPSLIAACENQVKKLEEERILLGEQLAAGGVPQTV